MSLSAAERETVVNLNDAEDVAYVYTAQRRTITKLRKNPAATLVEEGIHDGSAWARFEMPAGLISFRSVRVKREFTPEQRSAAAARLNAARASA